MSRSRAILVSKGERHLVRLVQVNLKRSGYDITCISSITEFKENLPVINPDFLIIDAARTELDGYSLARNVKDCPETAQLRVMLFIPSNAPEEIAKAKNSGADKYIVMHL